VLDALRDIAGTNGIDWPDLHAQMKREGRLHLETY
jgi:benzoyl-CoA 2,3-dioxygenase component A